ncbi:Similar to Purine permease; acc. no. P48777 [Pyronema omphalodes CBS 100304]|uniref:Similar to Purine permease acc. no. P48777 n=1 Tax=Pyronema omphalodes (strain CBS 100304) TaxID=1076935 RepID=U4LSK7_PYROM|nr:Similar to Purine permease; acc. no. P48777 [Pyronema omphalodes CBS 100304]
MSSQTSTSRGPFEAPRKPLGERIRRLVKAFTTREGLLGDYDYAFLFRPNLPFMKKSRRPAPFFGLDTKMPVILALILGFQHALAMLAGVITPPILLSGAAGANLGAAGQEYLVSTSLIVCGILSLIQITRFKILGTRVGTSFTIIPVAQGALSQLYANGTCPTSPDGTKLPCPDGYGAILGTACMCALVEIGLSFLPPRVLRKLFPPLVTGPTVMLIGVHLIESGFQTWAGGSGPCRERPTEGLFRLCPDINAPHPLPWGAPEFLGLGFVVFVTIIICERYGSPIMKSTAVVWGLLVGCVIAAGTGYFDDMGIKKAPAVSFIWVTRFKLSIYAPAVLPMMAVYIILACEAIGDIAATCEVSRLASDGELFDSRIQGGVLADGLSGCLAGLFTMTPMSVFAQNNGVISLTRCANRKAGFACCFFLILMGIFSKFAAALVSIPSAVLGGMTTFLFTSVAVSGMRIISTMEWNRRNRFVLTAALTLGYGATLVPDYFSYFFTYGGNNNALRGLLDAVELIMSTGFAVTTFVAMFLNAVLPMEIEEEEGVLDGDEVDLGNRDRSMEDEKSSK